MNNNYSIYKRGNKISQKKKCLKHSETLATIIRKTNVYYIYCLQKKIDKDQIAAKLCQK